MIVVLTPTETAIAEAVGRARQQSAIDNGRREPYGPAAGDHTDNHIQAAGGELAAAIAYRLPWTGVYFRGFERKRPDIGAGTEVRTCTRQTDRAIVHPDDNNDWTLILVAGLLPRYTVVGHRRVAACKRPEWWQDPGTGRPAYFVPRDAFSPPPAENAHVSVDQPATV